MTGVPQGSVPGPTVDIVEALDRLDVMPVDEHAAVFAAIHAELNAALASIDEV